MSKNETGVSLSHSYAVPDEFKLYGKQAQHKQKERKQHG
jgi:hypothetical protein